ncbi:MAG: hypothetical protein A2Y62_10975 [Candidatus Fischerbacteria bacterium RBG_13_37_8]|uniref:Methyltransferase domain-containing protein n=1 Tax=Candidatus Fischerbacteria bacterium RBG_13_37_8 TaxID=1817863 RepID=A0A1F5VUH3_9BACT|nr:MAG: hypothetical protein A2Y62_10975 [Candidatus Fischerbacteria bacterium RBG_13_37_8]
MSRLANNEWAPPGHYYSVIPSSQEIEEVINGAQNLPKGIDLHDAEQLQLLENLGKYYCDLPFTNKSADGLRYYYDNLSYSYSDAILLFCMIRYLKPQRIIEVGSGYTSCLMLDTNEKFFNNSIDLTFIEPYPQVLESLVQPDELSAMNLIKVRLQDIDLSVFDKLERSDILFIDSSHVVKCGSDLRYLFSEVLSSLRPGVVIHFHDIFYPFEMLAEWLKEGRYWNENYFLATFLQHNSCFKIILFSDYLHKKYPDWFKKNMPLCLKCRGGNIWLQKM